MRFIRQRHRLAAGIAAGLLTITLAACGSEATAAGTTGVAASLATSAGAAAGPASGSAAGPGSGSAAGPGSASAAGPGSGSAAGTEAGTGTAASTSTEAEAGTRKAAGGTVTLVTHDSFNMDKAVLAKFQQQSGITLKILAQGDAGAMVNKLVLTKEKPLGDVVFGVDNSFASRALDAGVLQPYASPAANSGAQKYSVDPEKRLTAVDYGDVCVNVDHAWFAAKKLAEPHTYEDLAAPQYKDLLVVPSAATSSPGLAFLLGTIAHFGEQGWQQYWTALKNNGVKVTAGWEDAYSVDFSGSSGKGARPLVLSYASSPPFEMADGATEAPTGALLDTCFRQVEYAGVLAGAANPDGAKKVVDFMLSKDFQAALPEQMYVYPVDTATKLPASWQKYAPAASRPATMDPATITAGREKWIGAWTDLVEG